MNRQFTYEVEPFEFETEAGKWEDEVNRSSRDYIKWVQQSLNQILGLWLAIDGISGTQTRSAVRSFQQQRGLTVDGIVGLQTEAALIAAGAGNPPGMGSTSPTPAPPAPGGALSATWVLPPDVRAMGERQYVRYDSPPAWDNGRNCAVSLTAGAAEVGDYLQSAFRGISSVGGHSCRQNTANLAQTSVHGTGRALDIMIPMVNGRANSAVGDPIANWLVQNAQAIGVQYIIWNRTKWSGSYSGRKDGAYGGPVPHIDHVHVELNRNGAARSTPWFLGRTQGSDGQSEFLGWPHELEDEESESLTPKVPVEEVNYPLPQTGLGYYRAKKNERRYGLVDTIHALTQIGVIWFIEHPNGPRIRIGDISKQGGGQLPPHGSHRMGIDVDIGLMRNDDLEQKVNFRTQPHAYSPERTQELVDVIRNNGALEVHKIWLGEGSGVNNVTPDQDHFDHLHVRFCVPARYSLYSMKSRAFPAGTKGTYKSCS